MTASLRRLLFHEALKMATKQAKLGVMDPKRAFDKRKGFVPPPSDTASLVMSFTHTQETGTNVGENLRFENTYKMEPDEGTRFYAPRVKEVASSVLESYLCDVCYDARRCSELSGELSALIKSRVKELGFSRYKLICLVSIGENTGQGVAIASRCLWNTATDNYASVTYRNRELFAVVTVYGLYLE